MAEIVEVGYADANPTEERLERFQRLARLQLNRVSSFERWAKERELTKEQQEIAQQAWNACFLSLKVADQFEILKRLTVFDESFRLPSLRHDSVDFKGNVEEKFGKLMLAVSLLTLEIQRDYEKEGAAENEEPWLHSSNQLM
jgi:hypothetical protein